MISITNLTINLIEENRKNEISLGLKRRWNNSHCLTLIIQDQFLMPLLLYITDPLQEVVNRLHGCLQPKRKTIRLPQKIK